MSRPRRTPLVAALVAATGALLALLLAPGVAAAHPEVTSTVPADGATVATTPSEVRVTFGSEFEAPIASLKVYDMGSQRVDNGDATVHPEHPRTVVATTGDLPDGTYLAIWRAVGLDDGHTVIGKFMFTVEDPAAAAAVAAPAPPPVVDEALVAAVVAEVDQTGPWPARVVGATRLFGIVGALLAAGAGLLVVARLRGRPGRWWRETSHDVRRLVTVGARMAVAAAVLQVPAEAWLRAGGAEGFGVALAGVLGGTVGLSVLVRVGAFLPFAVPVRTSSPVLVVGLWAVGLAGFVVEGHSISEEPFLVVALADMVHVGAGAVWFGGLVALAVVLRRASETVDAAGVAEVVAWFSSAAAVAVVAAGLAGAALAAVGVGSVDAATSSTYGLLVLAKAALAAVVVAIGGWNRFALVPRITGAVRPVQAGAATEAAVLPTRSVSVAPDAIAQLRRTVGVEAALLVGVLVLTVLLASQPLP